MRFFKIQTKNISKLSDKFCILPVCLSKLAIKQDHTISFHAQFWLVRAQTTVFSTLQKLLRLIQLQHLLFYISGIHPSFVWRKPKRSHFFFVLTN